MNRTPEVAEAMEQAGDAVWQYLDHQWCARTRTLAAEVERLEAQVKDLEADAAKLRAALEEIGGYWGEGSLTAPWREIVRSLGAMARTALVETKGAA